MSPSASALTGHLRRLLAEKLPANVILMHLLMRAREPGDALYALAAARRDSEVSDELSERISAIERLWQDHPDAWMLVQSAVIDHDTAWESPDEALTYWSERYDSIALHSPEASVALYSLGDPNLLSAATAEIIAYLRAHGLIAPDTTVLDLGCGIGRLVQALAPEVLSVDGIDVSAQMIGQALQRCAALPNVRLAQCSGKDLSCFAPDSFDLIVAVDVFPYLRSASEEFVRLHFHEAGRLLTTRGKLVILNFAYGIDLATQQNEIAQFADAAGLRVLETGVRPFKLWDGAAFVFEGK